jgi:hypothetical protein
VRFGVFAIARAITRFTKSERDDVVLGKIEKIVFPILRALGPVAGTTSVKRKVGDVTYGKGESIDPDRKRVGEPKRSAGSDEE